MSLPTTREHTYGADEPVRSPDLNAIQDAIIGAKKPSITRSSIIVPSWNINLSWNAGGGGEYYADGNLVQFGMALHIEGGERLTAVSLNVYGSGTTDVAYYLYKVGANGAVTNLLSSVPFEDINRAAAWGELVLPLTAPVLFASGESLALNVDGNANLYRWSGVRWTVDRL